MGRPRNGKRVFVKAEALEDLAARRNLSIAELARRCGYTANYFYKVLSHERSAGSVLRTRIMETLGLESGDEQDFDRLFFIRRIALETKNESMSNGSKIS